MFSGKYCKIVKDSFFYRAPASGNFLIYNTKFFGSDDCDTERRSICLDFVNIMLMKQVVTGVANLTRKKAKQVVGNGMNCFSYYYIVLKNILLIFPGNIFWYNS